MSSDRSPSDCQGRIPDCKFRCLSAVTSPLRVTHVSYEICQEIGNCFTMSVILEVALNGFIVTRGALSWASIHMSDSSSTFWHTPPPFASQASLIKENLEWACRCWTTWNYELPHRVSAGNQFRRKLMITTMICYDHCEVVKLLEWCSLI